MARFRIVPLLCLIPFLFTLQACEPIVPLNSPEELTAFQQEMLDAVNALRQEGCQCGNQQYAPTHRLSWNALLAQAAERHAKDMASHKHFGHKGTDGSTFSDRIESTGYRYANASENIAHGFSDVMAVMEAWKKSPGHCKNLMDPGVREMGAAKVSTYWVQNFAASLN
ncbi:MAG: CAP domain-containing protein [Bacteroidetes bacterium]|nr:MAG: CAP domain-containing protein [Bacteroidota bacterium]